MTTTAGASVSITGYGLTTTLGEIQLWIEIDDSQTANYSEVSTSQSPSWTDVTDSQSTDWDEVAA